MSYNGFARVRKTQDFQRWLDGLRDLHGRARILMRVDRLIHGNPGVHRHLTDAVSELKIDVGPGYRVYYSQRGRDLLLLLTGGDKASQAKDIAKAIKLAKTDDGDDDGKGSQEPSGDGTV